MNLVIAISGFLGAWLLVAGPLYQATIELREEEFDREGMNAAASTVEAPPALSPWWWLLPPVAYLLNRRRSRAHRTAIVGALAPAHVEQMVSFLGKANGWMIVAVGAFLLGVKETWELCEILEWPGWAFWIMVPLALALCILNVVASEARANRLLTRDKEAARTRPAKRGRVPKNPGGAAIEG